MLELALKQTGPACVKRAADYAQRAAAAEGSNAGIIKVGLGGATCGFVLFDCDLRQHQKRALQRRHDQGGAGLLYLWRCVGMPHGAFATRRDGAALLVAVCGACLVVWLRHGAVPEQSAPTPASSGRAGLRMASVFAAWAECLPAKANEAKAAMNTACPGSAQHNEGCGSLYRLWRMR